MAHSRKRLIGLCRDTLRRWFHDASGVPVDYDLLPESWRVAIMAAAEQASRDHEQPKFAIEEVYRGLQTARLDAAEDAQGPHRKE